MLNVPVSVVALTVPAPVIVPPVNVIPPVAFVKFIAVPALELVAIDPELDRELRVPTLVIFVWAAVLKVPVNVVADTVPAPVIVPPFSVIPPVPFVKFIAVPALDDVAIDPELDKEVSVPRLVIFACAAVESVPVNVVALTVPAPVKFPPFINTLPLAICNAYAAVNDMFAPLATGGPDMYIVAAVGNMVPKFDAVTVVVPK